MTTFKTAFHVKRGFVLGGDMQNGFSDGYYWVRGTLKDGGNHFFDGPHGDIDNARYAAVEMFHDWDVDTSKADKNNCRPDRVGAMALIEVGKRYWQAFDSPNGYHIGRWRMETEDTITEISARAYGYITDDAIAVLVANDTEPDNRACYGPFDEDFCDNCDDFDAEVIEAGLVNPPGQDAVSPLVLTTQAAPLVSRETTLRRITQQDLDDFAPEAAQLVSQYPQRYAGKTEREIFAIYPPHASRYGAAWFSQFIGYSGPLTPLSIAQFAGNAGTFEWEAPGGDASLGIIGLDWQNHLQRYTEGAPLNWYIERQSLVFEISAGVGDFGYQADLGYFPKGGNPDYENPDDWNLSTGVYTLYSNGVAKPYVRARDSEGNYIDRPNYIEMQGFLPVFNGTRQLDLSGDESSFQGAFYSVGTLPRATVPITTRLSGERWAIGVRISLQTDLVLKGGEHWQGCERRAQGPTRRIHVLYQQPYTGDATPWNNGFFNGEGNVPRETPETPERYTEVEPRGRCYGIRVPHPTGIWLDWELCPEQDTLGVTAEVTEGFRPELRYNYSTGETTVDLGFVKFNL